MPPNQHCLPGSSQDVVLVRGKNRKWLKRFSNNVPELGFHGDDDVIRTVRGTGYALDVENGAG